MHRKSHKFIIFCILLVSIILSACGGGQPANIPTSTVAIPTATTQPPTETPVPVANKVLIGSASTLQQDQFQGILQTIQDLSQKSGWQVDQIEAITKDEVAARANELKVVVTFPPDPGLSEMATAYPAITFISVGINGLADMTNLYQVAPQGFHPEWEGYLAGYIAAILTDDWRIGMLSQAGSPEAASAATGFYNGGVMYCGLCNPELPPYTDYPYTQEINAGSTQAEWQPLVDSFIQKQVKTAYVYPTVASSEVMLYLAQNSVRIISSTPPPAGLESVWIAVIKSDYAAPIISAWTDFTTDLPAGKYSVQIKITPVDGTLLSDGKMKWVNQVITDLTNGNLMP